MSEAKGTVPGVTERPCSCMGFHAGSNRGCFSSRLRTNESLCTGTCMGRAASSLNQSRTRGRHQFWPHQVRKRWIAQRHFTHQTFLGFFSFKAMLLEVANIMRTPLALKMLPTKDADRALKHRYVLVMAHMGSVPSPSDRQQIACPPQLHQGLNGTTGSHCLWVIAPWLPSCLVLL